MKLRARVLLPVIIVLVFGAIPAARIFFGDDDVAFEEPAPPVIVAPSSVGRAEFTLSYPGTLLADATTTVLPRVSGRVTEVLVRVNDAVDRDEPIVRIEDDVLRLQAQQAFAAWEGAEAQFEKAQRGAGENEIEIAEATVEQAEESLETARSNLDRTRRLYESGTVARATFEEAQDRFSAAETDVQNARRQLTILQSGASDEDLRSARAQADAARRQYDLAALQLEYATVRAPVAGTIASVLVEEGDTVGMGTPLAAIINASVIRAVVNVPERHYGDFLGRADDIEVRVEPTAYSERFSGRITSLASVVSPASRTFEVEVAIPNADGRLRPGMYMLAEFVISVADGATLVPDGAVVRRDGIPVVYALRDDGTVEERIVEVAELDGGVTQVVSGLLPDEVVVIAGNAFLEDGQRVQIVEAM